MGFKYDFWLVKVDYTVETRTGDWGTDSKVELQVLRKSGGTWDVISDKWVEPGSTGRLDAGKKESFSRTFASPVSLGPSNDAQEYQKLVRFRFKIYGDDKWSPASIQMNPTFNRRDWNNGGLVLPVVESWNYNPNNWILSTDPAEGGDSKDHDGNPATLTLLHS